MWYIILLLTAALLQQPTPCPADIPLGTTGILRSGDAFDGRPITVFQHGWYPDGTHTYVVRLDDNTLLGASACQIEVETPDGLREVNR